MSEQTEQTPIGQLLAAVRAPREEQDAVLWKPPADRETPPGAPIARFEDLKIGMELAVWIRDRWDVGTVHDIRTRRADGRVVCLIKHYQTTATSFVFADTWERRDRKRVCLPSAADVDRARAGYRGLRQAAKSQNFGGCRGIDPPRAVELVDGMTRAVCFETFEKIQREEIRPYKIVHGAEIPQLTAAQLTVAKEMWSERVCARVTATRTEDARREREQVICDDDRWDP